MAPIKAIGINNFTPGSDANNSLYYWAKDIEASNTPWVRMWVDWKQLAPTAPPAGQPINPAADTTVPAGGGYSPAQYVAYIDFQLRAAKQAGLQTILTYWLYPEWVNGGETNPYRPALDVSLDSPWAQYLLWIMTRWNSFNEANEGGFADIVEICNENDILSLDPVLRRQDATTTADMIVTACTLYDRAGLQAPILAGPGNTDSDGFGTWMDWLIGDLKARSFTGHPNFAWSMHNYGDVALNSTARIQSMRAMLAPFWSGWPTGRAGDDSVFVLLTEGGSGLRDRRDQRNQMVEQFRLCSDPVTGKGLLMLTQFLNVSSPVFDTGMRNFNVSPGGTLSLERQFPKRPLWRSWANL